MMSYMWDSVLEHLTVNNGNAVYIDDVDPDRILCDDNFRLQQDVMKMTSNKPSNSKEKDIPEEHHEEHYETYEEYCIHMGHLANQGITMCDINQDVTMCGSCPYRKSRTMKVKVSSASVASTK